MSFLKRTEELKQCKRGRDEEWKREIIWEKEAVKRGKQEWERWEFGDRIGEDGKSVKGNRDKREESGRTERRW
jgi:hypothetical protein